MDEESRFDRNRRGRSVALGLVLAALAILVFLMSIVKWGGHVFH